ncbi:hypothetical protein M885DRAFT_565507 [Pelagophyceae sp. CCMP2097]|nr:hypothetical protein M885DRAFT_565507 [Pelagophyceae sp. CCMP2097]
MIQRLCLALLAGGASARQLRGGGAFPKALDNFIASFSFKLVLDDLALSNADPAARLAIANTIQEVLEQSDATPGDVFNILASVQRRRLLLKEDDVIVSFDVNEEVEDELKAKIDSGASDTTLATQASMTGTTVRVFVDAKVDVTVVNSELLLDAATVDVQADRTPRPTPEPMRVPSPVPTSAPSSDSTPTSVPMIPAPSAVPSSAPSSAPTVPAPSSIPSAVPSAVPSFSESPTNAPATVLVTIVIKSGIRVTSKATVAEFKADQPTLDAIANTIKKLTGVDEVVITDVRRVARRRLDESEEVDGELDCDCDTSTTKKGLTTPQVDELVIEESESFRNKIKDAAETGALNTVYAEERDTAEASPITGGAFNAVSTAARQDSESLTADLKIGTTVPSSVPSLPPTSVPTSAPTVPAPSSRPTPTPTSFPSFPTFGTPTPTSTKTI